MEKIRRIFVAVLAAAMLLWIGIPAAAAGEPAMDLQLRLQMQEALDKAFLSVTYEEYPIIPLYIQQDYPDAPFGTGTVATNGCGVSALAMLATYMTDEEYTPADIAEMFAAYGSAQGTAFALFDDAPAALDFGSVRRAKSHKEAIKAVENGYPVVSLQFAGLFTTTAHFIVLEGMTEDGKIMVKDSNGFHYKGNVPRYVDGFENGFTVQEVTRNASIFWIYDKKVTSIPACSRCGDFEDSRILREAYYCGKCGDAMKVHASYRAICQADHADLAEMMEGA